MIAKFKQFACCVVAVSLQAGDWPQLLGPNRNGTIAASEFAWDGKSALRQVWKRDVGAGFAGPVIASGKAILFHRVGGKEVVEAIDPASGKTIWKADYPTTYRDDFGFDEGPRSAPTVAVGKIFTFGAEGRLSAFDLATGKLIWQRDTHKDFSVRKGYFGAAGAPLYDDGRVIQNVGGSTSNAGIVAFDAGTGKTLWAATTDEASYSSPVIATIGGEKRALFLTRTGFVDLDPATGKVRSQLRWRARYAASVNAATPLAIGNLVFISASYETGANLLDLSGGAPKSLWSGDEILSNHYATSVHSNGYLYGYHGRQEMGPILRCVELKTGKVMWETGRFGAGSITLLGDNLLIIKEGGEVVLAPATPKAYQPGPPQRLLPATIRAFPAIANGLLIVRNETMMAVFAAK